MKTKDSHQLTLHDRLSRLSYSQACRLLGAGGAGLIRAGGQYEIDIPGQVRCAGDLFRLRLNGAVVTITLKSEARQRLHWNCTSCDGACEHVGAAFSLILEEKTVLGLAKPPPERVPIESLSEEDLVHRALRDRQERAREEKMTLRSSDPDKLWTDYTITTTGSGKTYRLAVRGTEPGKSYCSCPDFRSNTLGTCKHLLHALPKLRRRFPADRFRRPYRRKNISLVVRYDQDLSLRLLLPAKLEPAVAKVVQPLRDRPLESNPRELVRRLRKLDRLGHEVMVYPDAEELLQRRLFQDRISSLTTEIRRRPKSHPLRRTLLQTELLPYQLDGIAFAIGAGRAILADDMGLGKTIQAIGVAELLAQQAGIKKVLVVCPASVKSQWRGEIQRHSLRDCQLVLGSAESRARQYDNRCFFTVCNYEQVLRDVLAIEQVRWDLIILDEGQRIKNYEAKTSTVIKNLRSPFALVLSGTPLENRLDELYSVVQFIDDRRLAPAFRFFNRHRMIDEKGKVLGYKNLLELRKTLRPVLLRRTRDSVMRQLPPRTTEIVRIAPTDEQLELHGSNMRIVSNIIHKPFLSEMDLLRLQKALLLARMAANGTYLVDKQEPGYSSKLERLDELLGQLLAERGRKILLFSEWTTMLNLIEPSLKKRKAGYVRLDGSVPQKKRQALVHEFQNDPACRLFITTNAGATGLNLQAANTVVNVDLPWNPAVLEQRIGRAHRMGQRRPVQIFLLVTEETIEENLLATLSAKHQLALAVLDPDSDIDQVMLASGMEELRNRLEILLGAKAAAPIDESVKARKSREAELLSRKDRVAAAGGDLLSSAFSFLGEILPSPDRSGATDRMASELKQRFRECMNQDEHGRTRLSVILPDTGAVDQLAESVARLLATTQETKVRAGGAG